MIETLTQPGNVAFSVALVVMLLLAVLQFVGLADMLGADADIDMDAEGDMAIDSGLLSLIGFGRLPFTMWLMILLGIFAAIGFAGQAVIAGLTGGLLSPWLAAPLAGVAALPVTGIVARPLSRVLPKDETTAIDIASLVGREAEIEIGTASQGNPARGKVVDHFGQVHHVMLEPDNQGQTFAQGERVLLVRREGELFMAIARGDHHLPRL